MKTAREWAEEFDRRWTQEVRHPTKVGRGPLEILAEIIEAVRAEQVHESRRVVEL